MPAKRQVVDQSLALRSVGPVLVGPVLVGPVLVRPSAFRTFVDGVQVGQR